jgi:nitrogen regulatory protein PII
MNFKLIIAMVKTNATDEIVTAAKAAGGTGATIIPARGTGIHEAKTFFGLTLEDQTDVVLFLLESNLVAPVLASISKIGCLKEAGTGIAFVIDVEHALGLESQLEYFRRAAEKQD